MKKKFAIFLSLLTLFCFPSNVSAENNTPLPLHEFELYQELQAHSAEELLHLGLTEKDALAVKNTSFEDLLFERASLPESTLKNMGYSAEDIAILKAYEGETVTADSEVLSAATAACTGSLKKVTSSGFGEKKTLTFQFDWSWDRAPLFSAADIVALNWNVYDTNGNSKSSDAAAKGGSVTYVDISTGKTSEAPLPCYTHYAAGGSAEMLVTGKINEKTDSGTAAWARSGTMEVTVSNGGAVYIPAYATVTARYRHSIASADTQASLISFFPAEITEECLYDSKLLDFRSSKEYVLPIICICGCLFLFYQKAKKK